MKKRALAAPLCALVMVVVAGCGGGDDDALTPRTTETDVDTTETPEASDDPTTTTEGPDETTPASTEPVVDSTTATTATTAAGELPSSLSEFDRVCTTQVGFSGASAYDETQTGLHPFVLFEEWREDGDYLETVHTFPAGWLIEQDSNFDDDTDLAPTQLVGCADRVRETSTGVTCDLDADDGTTVTLELMNAEYDVSLYSAVTGESIGFVTVKAESDECPFFAFTDPGQTQFFNTPSDDDYTVALRPFVER